MFRARQYYGLLVRLPLEQNRDVLYHTSHSRVLLSSCKSPTCSGTSLSLKHRNGQAAVVYSIGWLVATDIGGCGVELDVLVIKVKFR